MSTKRLEIKGQVFSRLTVLERAPSVPKQGAAWRCRCVCGKEKTLLAKLIKSGITKSCGCLRDEIAGARFKVDPFRALYNSLVATKRYDVLLTYEDFLTFTKISACHYCSAPIGWCAYNNRGRKLCRYNLDRKDNDLPYTVDNCVVCCIRCNYAKRDHFSYEQWLQIGALIKTWK